jgi:hypothetical protein
MIVKRKNFQTETWPKFSQKVAQLALRISTTKTVSHPDGLAVFEAGYIG